MRFSSALALSVCVHALLGGAIAAFLMSDPAPDRLPQLDLSALELSFAEEVQEAPPLASPPPDVKPAEPTPQTPPQPPPPDVPAPTPPDPLAAAETESPAPPPPPPEKRRAPTPPPPSPSSAAAPRQATVEAPPRPRRMIKPDYPRGARARGEQGEVELEIEVGANGRVAVARIVRSSGYAELDDAALAAVRDARFIPAKSGNTSVPSVARLKLRFQLK